MPAQDCVRPHEQLHCAQSLHRQPVQQGRQQRSVTGLQSHLLIAELALQHGSKTLMASRIVDAIVTFLHSESG